MVKVVSDEDFILWKSAEWDVSEEEASEEEARRIIESQKKTEKYKAFFSATIDQEVEIPF